MPFHVYILRCSDSSLYIGYAEDVNARVALHNAGRGATHTADHRPVQLVYQESHETEIAARKRERQIKRGTHVKKLALINGDRTSLKSLAKRRVF
jgi:putative endonuclease